MRLSVEAEINENLAINKSKEFAFDHVVNLFVTLLAGNYFNDHQSQKALLPEHPQNSCLRPGRPNLYYPQAERSYHCHF